jgi:hypothetical protein
MPEEKLLLLWMLSMPLRDKEELSMDLEHKCLTPKQTKGVFNTTFNLVVAISNEFKLFITVSNILQVPPNFSKLSRMAFD